MNRLISIVCIAAMALLLAGAAVAQTWTAPAPRHELQPFNEASPLAQEGGNVWFRSPEGQTAFFSVTLAGDQLVKGAPYTATAATKSTQTLLDGNHIVHSTTVFLARDGQGRTRREQTLDRMGSLRIEGPEVKVVVINDPVTHSEYILKPWDQTARIVKREGDEKTAEGQRKKLEGLLSSERGEAITYRRERGTAETEEKALGGLGENRVKIETKHEDLGVQQLEDVSCRSRRETVTIPAGAEGNERPLQIVSENCYSDELHAFVLRKHSDPRFGDTEYRLTNIKLGEPDASLFTVPNTYKTTTTVERLPRD